ncbi:hypothetical protein MMYC01_204579 [Madurella mycetomatis]|uniref:Uncharacterized protein n=1 Tax=Madurella mycetomatis TaxID=100816 RepID=A0A175W5J4_9PEZI|nr:hypothetical protein MMYC01_204579 [Madurella mycetomatis]
MDQRFSNYAWLPPVAQGRGQRAGQGTSFPGVQNDGQERGRVAATGRLIPLPAFPQGPPPDRSLPPIPQEETSPPPPPGLSITEREVILRWIYATAFPEGCEPAGALGGNQYFEAQYGQVWVEERSATPARRDRVSASLRDLFELIEIIEGRCLYPELEAPAEEEEEDEEEGDFQATWPVRPPSETGLGLWLAANRKASNQNHTSKN